MGLIAGLLIVAAVFSVGWAWEPQGEVFPWGETSGCVIGEVVDWGKGWVLLRPEDGHLVALPYDEQRVFGKAAGLDRMPCRWRGAAHLC